MKKYNRLFSKGDERIINASQEDFAKALGYGKEEDK